MYVDIEAMEFCDTVMEKSLKSHGILSRRFRGNPVMVTALRLHSKVYTFLVYNVLDLLGII